MRNQLSQPQWSFWISISALGAVTAEPLPIKPLINDIAPTLENLQTGQCPPAKPLCSGLPRIALPADAQAFIDFVGSREGVKILRANSYGPLGQQ